MSDEDEIRAARQASEILENPAVIKAFAEIEEHYFQVWKNSTPSQYELREEAYGQLFALSQFQRQLQTFLGRGKILSAVNHN